MFFFRRLSSEGSRRPRVFLAAVFALLSAALLCAAAQTRVGVSAWADAGDEPRWDDAPWALTPEDRLSYLKGLSDTGDVAIHVMAFSGCDAILIESDGRFGLVDAGEDNDYPDGSDPRYPLREGVVRGGGHEAELIAYMKSLGVTSENLEFVLGTHPHSDHIGAMDEVIYEFRPATVYLLEYQDSYVTKEAALWDNQYVYDHVVQAALDTQATLVQFFDDGAPVLPSSGQGADPEPDDGADPDEDADPDLDDDAGSEPDDGAQGDGALPEPDGDAFVMVSPEALLARFGVDPTDGEGDPNNDGTLPGGVVAVPLSDNPNEMLGEMDPSRTGNPVFMLGSALIEVMNFSDDYKFVFKPDANYFSLGVKVSAGGRSAFLAGDINNYDGDESRLAPLVGEVDFLKLGHHGLIGSSTWDFLEALNPSVVMQTSAFANTNQQLVGDLRRLGCRHYASGDLIELGQKALVVTMSDGRVSTNVAISDYHVRVRSDSPHYYLFRNFVPVRYSGIVEDRGRQFFFKNSYVALESAWYADGSRTYRLDAAGLPLKGDQTIDGKRYRFDEETGELLKGPRWVDEGSSRFWITGDGSFATGWQLIGGTWYWFDPQTCAMATGWLEVGGERYLLGEDGAMAFNRWVSWEGRRYWACASGALASGWQLVDGQWYWFDPQTYAMATGWYKVNGEWNWSDSEGVWHPNEWKRNDVGWWYAWADGTYPTSSWQLVGGKWYRFDGSGYMRTGWCLAGGRWYYLGDDGAMRIGWQSVGGAWYYLGEDADDGAMRTGWQKVSGQWYFLEDSGAMATSWKRVGGTWYYLTGSGSMAIGWQKVGGEWYYLGEDADDGAMRTGWQKVGGTWYFLRESGAMAHGCWVGSYYVDGSGAMVTDAWVDGYYVDASGRWDPSR